MTDNASYTVILFPFPGKPLAQRSHVCPDRETAERYLLDAIETGKAPSGTWERHERTAK